MADITPITREELYLAKAGGQDVPVPSAVTREEKYLEKLSNDSVVVPSPVTRREKFLYFACGGDIALPSEDRMTRLERLIAKAGGMDVSTPTAVTRLEKFWAKVEGGWKIAELTGTLPMTFRSNGTALIDYRIYGVADGAGTQTENLFNETIEQGGWSGTPGNPPTKYNINTRVRCSVIFETPIDNYIIAVYPETLRVSVLICDSNGDTVSNTGWSNSNYQTINNLEKCVIVIKNVSDTNISPSDIEGVCIVKGSTPPETYIPHGYKTPFTVTSETESKDTDIYIGDTKLLSGDYIDYESGKIVRNGTPQDPPLPLPAIETFNGTNILDSTETLGEVTITGKIKEAEQ